MSTPRLFKPQPEEMEAYKPYTDYACYSNDFFNRALETEILVQCMSNNDNTKTTTLFDDLRSRFKLYETSIRSETRYNVYSWYKDNEDGILEIYGRDYYAKEDVTEILYDIIEDLVLFAKVVKCDDYFAQNSNFFSMKGEIKDKIAYIRDVFYENELNNIMNDLKDCEINDNELS